MTDATIPAAVHDSRSLIAVSPVAVRRGVRRSMRRRQALAICPDLQLIADDAARQARAFEAVMSGISEVIALPVIVRPGLVIADARGPERHCGGALPLAERTTGAIIEASGAEGYVGIADGILAAILAARTQRIIEAGASAEFLSSQPLTALLSAAIGPTRIAETRELVNLCARFGIHTIGEFLGLSRSAVATRFGASGLAAYDLADGRDVVLPHAAPHEGDVSVGRDLDPPVTTTTAAAFLARTLAEQLAERLAARHCTHLVVLARTVQGSEYERTWVVSSTDGGVALTPRDVTDRVRWQLDAWLTGRGEAPPDGELAHLQLRARGVGLGSGRGVPLWGKTRAREGGERVLTRLQSLAGLDNVYVVLPQGGRDPRGRALVRPAIASTTVARTEAGPWCGALPGPAPTTVLDRRIAVTLRDANGCDIPARAGELGWMESPRHYRLAAPLAGVPREGEVLEWAGPWPMHERWWRGHGVRVYLQLVLAQAPPLLIVGIADTWRVEGSYD
ncbi:MAG: hypothetical protein Q4P36_02785 [Bowdeniella nasicola]|nr:hypothetical protein [Bowdeniella nasicola]